MHAETFYRTLLVGLCSIFFAVWPYHNGSQVLAFKATDGVVQRLVHGCGDPLGDQAVEVNGATQQLKDTGVTLKREERLWEEEACKKTMYGATLILPGGPYLHVSLFEECLVAVRWRVRNNHAIVFTLCPKAFV